MQTNMFTIIKVSHKANISALQKWVNGFALSDPSVTIFPLYYLYHPSVQTKIFYLTMIFTPRNTPLVMFIKSLNKPIENHPHLM